MNQSCDRCGDVLLPGEVYFDTPTGCYCEDCFEFIVRRLWRHEVGDVVDRV